MRLKSIAVLALVLPVAACSSFAKKQALVTRAASSNGAIGDPDAIQLCQNELLGPNNKEATSIAGAFHSTLGEVNRWRNSREGPNGPQHLDSDQTSSASETVCYVNGSFQVSSPPGSGPFNLAVIWIDATGKTQLDVIGNPSNIDVVRPAPAANWPPPTSNVPGPKFGGPAAPTPPGPQIPAGPPPKP